MHHQLFNLAFKWMIIITNHQSLNIVGHRWCYMPHAGNQSCTIIQQMFLRFFMSLSDTSLSMKREQHKNQRSCQATVLKPQCALFFSKFSWALQSLHALVQHIIIYETEPMIMPGNSVLFRDKRNEDWTWLIFWN